MLDVKDPGIKLFGKTIPLPDSQMSVEPSEISDLDNQIPDTDQQPDQLNLGKDECRESKAEIDDSCEEPCKLISAESGDKGGEDGSQSPKKKEIIDAKPEEDQVTSNTSGQEKVLKKPDKVIPCPRCNSLETKFCYYNNYNVNQPRHFCKNCQRYWTAGGTMRNVPVGAGRRKNKHIASQYRHIMMSSEVVPTAHSPDSSNRQGLPCGPLSTPSRPLSANESVLKFCPEAPLCESMTSVLNLGNQKKQAEITGGVSGESSQKLSSCGSSMMTSACRAKIPESAVKREQHSVSDSCNGPTPHPLPCYAGPPWVYPWNSGLNGVDPVAVNRCSSELLCRPDNGNTKQVHWGSTQMVATPAFCTPSIPFPFVPATYWGCMQGWAAGAWNVPWAGSPSPSSSTSNSGCSSNGSPTLGKHSRDVNLQGEDKSEKCLWVPKTLRIDDPDEAAKSSIWATLGIKPNENESLPKGGIFKAFQPKTEASSHVSDVTHVMHANPAALSRSQTFQEST